MADQKGMKSGVFTEEDRLFIASNCDTMFYKDIAAKLKRNPETIRKYIKKKLGRAIKRIDDTKTKPTTIDLQNSLMWQELVLQFTPKELNLFLYHWNRILSQFKEDVFPTEELQIIDMIKLEILMNRALEGEQESRNNILRYKKAILEENAKPEEERDTDKVHLLEDQIALDKAAYESIHSEYTDLLQKKTIMLKDLKATREQRIKRLDDSRQSFSAWIKELLDNRELRRQLGLFMEKNRVAIDVEEARLFEPHKFLDNEIDLPILTADSLDKLEQANKEENKDNK